MKQFIYGLLLSIVAMSVQAGVVFPDETSNQGLPYAFPCIEKPSRFKGYKANDLVCRWNNTYKPVQVWEPQQNQYITYYNTIKGSCINGTCKTEHGVIGYWGRDIDFNLALWYYIYESADGAPLAYLIGQGPLYNGKAVTYAEAGRMLEKFYMDSGVPADSRQKMLDERYFGGWDKYVKDSKSVVSKTNVTVDKSNVTAAWCSQTSDDDCTINGKPVRKADLGKYLPIVDSNDVSSDGGYCEYPICYDEDDKPIGITR